jgi:hypothetical protein
MKKVITLLMAMTMVIGFAGFAAADCFNCGGTAGNIDRGCESGQDYCEPFDFENHYDRNSYCSEDKNFNNRAIFKICDCITDGDFETVIAGDTIDISMEILVNGEDGDNGVYWAEGVGTVWDPIDDEWDDWSEGVGLGLYEDQDEACDSSGYGEYFEGYYEFLTAAGTQGYPWDGVDSDCDDLENINRVVKFQLENTGNPHGYVIQEADEVNGNATWAIDIPWMRVDPSRVNPGDQVWVRICLILDCAGICSEDVICCCDIYIGELCCAFDTSSGAGLIYPYFPPANTTVWNLLGMTITNLSAIDGTAMVTMYESDGDVGEVEIDVDANSIFLETIPNVAALMTQTDGAGTLGDAKCYFTVDANFPATGFAMIADTIDGASMGYLPLQAWEVDVYGLLGEVME